MDRNDRSRTSPLPLEYTMKTIRIRAIAAALIGSVVALGPLTVQAQVPGSADADFGIGGRQSHDFHDRDDRIQSIKPLKNGRFLAAGYVVGPNVVGPGSSPNFTIARFLPDGRIDPTFGVDGRREIDLGGGVDLSNGLAVLPDRSMVLVGNMSIQSYSDLAIVKLTANGAIDTSFGMPNGQGGRMGYTLLDLGGATMHDDGVAVAVQSTGKIVVAGITLRPHGSFMYRRVAVARFNPDGMLDTSFGGAGTGYVVLEPFFSGEGSDYVTGLALDGRDRLPGNDSITVVGYTFARNNGFLARLTANGQLDTSFGAPVAGGGRSGRMTLQHSVSGGVHSGVSSVAAARRLPDGRIALAGTGGDRGITFMRLQADGTVDTSFGTNGRTTVKFSDPSRGDEPYALALQGNGRLVAAGYAINGATGAPHKDFFLARVNADGSPDFSFGDGQARAVVSLAATTDEAYALAIEPSGKLLAGGYLLRAGTSQHDFALLRLHGDPDRIFFHDFEVVP
jgi:uncharacterized delta-60 repeat protein